MKTSHRVAAALLIVVILSACRGAAPPDDGAQPGGTAATAGTRTAGPSGEVKNPDTFTQVIAGWGDDNYDPAINYAIGTGGYMLNMSEPLIVFDGSATDRFQGRLATAVPSLDNDLIRDGGRTYVFPIRRDPKVTFQYGPVKGADGQVISGSGELTPEDVAYSFQRGMLADPAGGPEWFMLQPLVGTGSILDLAKKIEEQTGGKKASDVASIDDVSQVTRDAVCKAVKDAVTVDGDNVVFHLVEPYAPFLQLMVGSWATILDKEWVAAEIKDETGKVVKKAGWDGDCRTWRSFYGRKLEDSELRKAVNGTGPFKLDRWVANEGWTLVRNDDYWRGPARLKRIEVKIVPEFSTRLLMLQQGDADIIDIPATNIDQVQPLVAQGFVREIKGQPTIVNEGGISFNQKVAADNNPYIGSGKLDGQGIPPDFFGDIDVRKGFAYAYDWDTDIRDAQNGDAIRARGPIPSLTFGFDPKWPIYEYDPAKAEEHFRKAFGGQLWEKGFKLWLAGDPSQPNPGLLLWQQGLSAINPKFVVEQHPVNGSQGWQDHLADMIPLQFEGWGEDFHDPDDWVQPFLSSQGFSSSYLNFDPAVQRQIDDLIAQARREMDPKKRAAIYSQIGYINYDNALLVWNSEGRPRIYERAWLQGIVRNPARWGEDYWAWYKANS